MSLRRLDMRTFPTQFSIACMQLQDEAGSCFLPFTPVRLLCPLRGLLKPC